MSEAGDYSPGVWSGHDFDDARKSYRSYANTSYSKAVSKGVTLKDLVPTRISTESTNVVAVATDGTGSMEDWPATMASKMPYLEHEARTEYLGKDVEFSWCSFGDANSTGSDQEDYPLVVRPFAKGKDLLKRIEELVYEKKGGGQTQETSELAALYYARNVDMPNAIRSLFVIITDESPYSRVNIDKAAAVARVTIEKAIDVKRIFADLNQKWSVYIVQKPYGNERLSDGPLTGTTKKVHEDWAALVGEDHIALLADPGRVVDVIFGIMAREAGKIKYFKKELEDRQKPDQVKAVYTSLRTIHALPKGGHSKRLLGDGRSVTRRVTKDSDND